MLKNGDLRISSINFGALSGVTSKISVDLFIGRCNISTNVVGLSPGFTDRLKSEKGVL
jgi:hypothetical protein